ncbi:MAG: hypothetical protein QNJ38_13380 [Prochloraceae cyanobacterium]|nr:hypothetical protein [Prochloraceae cyanobacterium]
MIDKLIFQELTDAEAANLTGGNVTVSPTGTVTLENVIITTEPADPAEPGEVAEPPEQTITGTIGTHTYTLELEG